MFPAALHKIPKQTVDSSQVFERRILQKQPRIINQIEKVGKKTIKGLQHLCPKQDQDFLSWLLSSRTIFD